MKNCPKTYYSNFNNVGFRINQANSIGVVADGHVSFNFYKPWIAVQFIQSGGGSGPSFINMASPIKFGTYSDLAIESFFNICAQANLTGGLDPTSSILYTPIDGIQDWSTYMNNHLNPAIAPINLVASKYPEALVGSWWKAAQAGAFNSIILGAFPDNIDFFCRFLQFLEKSTDLSLWGAPGNYSVDTTSAYATTANSFNDMFSDVGSDTDMSYLVIEQISIA